MSSRHGQHPSSRTPRPHRSNVTYSCSSPHLHLWNLASDVSACSAHVVLAGRPTLLQAQQTAELVKAELADRFGLIHVTLELEDLSSTEPTLVGAASPQNSATKEH